MTCKPPYYKKEPPGGGSFFCLLFFVVLGQEPFDALVGVGEELAVAPGDIAALFGGVGAGFLGVLFLGFQVQVGLENRWY